MYIVYIIAAEMSEESSSKNLQSIKKSILERIPTEYLRDYSRSTSFHGIKYLGEKNRHVGERICWILVLCLCFYLICFLIGESWFKKTYSPVIVTYAESTTPLWQIPFPAVTICSVVKSRASKFNFTERIANGSLDDDDKKKVGAVSLLCDDDILVDGENYADNFTMDFLKKVSPLLEESAVVCKWLRQVVNCSNLYTRIVTEEGICFSFNMLDKNDLFRGDVFPYLESTGQRAKAWTLEEGYHEEALLDTYPYRGLSPGRDSGLFTVLMAERIDADTFCKGPILGFKVILHNPAEFPLVGERYLRIPVEQEVLAVIQPNIMTINKELQSYEPHLRHCYFPSERYLAFFKVYTQSNCELECLTNYTLQECECVALHMPRRFGTPTCGPGKKRCMIKAAHILRMSKVNSSYKKKTNESCGCMPACISIAYSTESSQADYNFREVLSAYGENITLFEPYNASRLSIFFKEMHFTTISRKEHYGTVDFVASCGGLIGLLCGGSFLSIVELLYYISLRIWGNVNIEKKKTKEIKNN